jgi:hypothetical protein
MKKRYGVVAALSLLYFLALVQYARMRGIDPDEGYYPTAARLVWEGKIPYRDFSFPQGVVIPYLYSWIWAVHPQSLVSMRVLSAALGALAVFLWGLCLVSVKRLPPEIAISAFLLILLNPYWIAWHTVVKTFAVANLLTSLAMISFYVGFQSGRSWWFFVAGTAMGACASARGLYAPLVPIALLWLALQDWREFRGRGRRALAYLAGASCATLPMLLSFAVDPSAFLFNTMQYRHLLDRDVTTGPSQTVHLYLSGIYNLVQRPFFVGEVLLALLGGFSLLKLRKTKDGTCTRQDFQYFQLAFLMMAVYAATSLIPLPMFAQYFDSPVLPFLVFFIAEGLRVIHRAYGKWAVVSLCILAAVLSWRGVRVEAGEFSALPRLQLPSYREVAEAIRANSSVNAVVLSFWPGYVFESGRQCFPGAENEFGYAVARRVGPEVRARYHMASKEEVFNAVSSGAPDIYIPVGFRRYLAFTMSEAETQALENAVAVNYSLVKTVDDVPIYRRKR